MDILFEMTTQYEMKAHKVQRVPLLNNVLYIEKTVQKIHSFFSLFFFH